MLSIARLAHHRDPEAIAEIIRQELQRFASENLDEESLGLTSLEVKVAIDDSSLDLQIHTNSALDKEKLLTLVRSELQNLHIESVAKVRVHCWRNNEEIDAEINEESKEQQPLWSEQFMLEPQSLSYQGLTLEPETKVPETRAPETRAPEPQLSKHSVLQQAIAKISTSDSAKKQLLVDVLKLTAPPRYDLAEEEIAINPEVNPSISELKTSIVEKRQEAIDNNYWQLLLVGLSIVLLGLGIGAMVRAITLKNLAEKASVSASPNQPIETAPINSIKAINKDTTPKISTQSTTQATTLATTQSSDPYAITTNPSSNSPKPNPSSLETATPTPNDSESSASPSPLVSPEDATTITLEKFNRIQQGMSIEQVEKIFGISGKIIAETNTLDSVGRVYSWKNPEGSNAIIEFKDGQVVAKAQAGL